MANYHSLACQNFDTKCAVCRVAIPPTAVHTLRLTDFINFQNLRARPAATLADGWDKPTFQSLGYTIWTRGTINLHGPALAVCAHGSAKPFAKHFYSPIIPCHMIHHANADQKPFTPPTSADLAHLHPVRCHARYQACKWSKYFSQKESNSTRTTPTLNHPKMTISVPCIHII